MAYHRKQHHQGFQAFGSPTLITSLLISHFPIPSLLFFSSPQQNNKIALRTLENLQPPSFFYPHHTTTITIAIPYHHHHHSHHYHHLSSISHTIFHSSLSTIFSITLSSLNSHQPILFSSKAEPQQASNVSTARRAHHSTIFIKPLPIHHHLYNIEASFHLHHHLLTMAIHPFIIIMTMYVSKEIRRQGKELCRFDKNLLTFFLSYLFISCSFLSLYSNLLLL